jgi:hypothetical protein
MDNIMHDYTAGELLEWLENEDIAEYIDQEIEVIDGESVVIESLDIDKVKSHFLYHIRRYIVVKRGYKLYIHDNKNCLDIMMFKFSDVDEEEVNNYVNSLCHDLNERKISFIGKKYRCD